MRKLLLLCCFCASTGLMQAQAFGGQIFAGMSASQLNGDGLGGFDLPGARLGFSSFVHLNQALDLNLELALLQKGSREVPSDTSNFYRARLNMVEIPLIVTYRYNDLEFELGPALDILAHSREESQGIVLESDPAFKRFSLAGIAGVSYRFSPNWHINFRTNYSITPVRSNEVPYNPAIPRAIGGNGWRNFNLSFAVYFRFRDATES